MLDNDLIRKFLPIVNAGLIARGYTGVTTKQSNQPTQQGAMITPTVYFYKLYDKRFGWVKRDDFWDADLQVMRHRETQNYETTFQFSAMAVTNDYTASDLINSVAQIMQSYDTIETLTAQSVGILRITDVRNPYFTDDRDRFEAFPSFDITFNHQQSFTATVPIFDSYGYAIYPV